MNMSFLIFIYICNSHIFSGKYFQTLYTYVNEYLFYKYFMIYSLYIQQILINRIVHITYIYFQPFYK